MTVMENAIGKLVLQATKEEIRQHINGGKLLLTYMHRGQTTIRSLPIPNIQEKYPETYYIFDPYTNAWSG